MRGRYIELCKSEEEMSCHGFLVAGPGPIGGGGGMGGHRPSIPVALIAQRALHAVASAQPVALPLPPPPPSMPPPPLPPAAAIGHLVVQCPIPGGGGGPPHCGRAEAVPKCKDGGGGDPPAQVGSAEILRKQHLAQQRQRTQQKGGKAAAEVPSGRTVLGTPIEVMSM